MGHLHINQLELKAVELALAQFEHALPLGHIRVVSDNMSVVAAINRQGGTRSPSLSILVEGVLLWAFQRGCILSARHVVGSLNIVADLLSRNHEIIPTEWTLEYRVLEPVWQAWGLPMVDLFATRFNSRLPMFVSPVPDPRAWAVDALTLCWTGLFAYAFPPLPLIPKVIRKVIEDRPQMILIAPKWPAQMWFPQLLALSHSPPIDLGVVFGDLFQPRSKRLHGNPEMFHLHAWLLCAEGCGQQDCQKGRLL
jgi:hypothetical protein